MLDLRLLHQAITLAGYRNYARAAKALHMTQPALSRSIAGLEARLGERLFDRTGQGVEPTAFGKLLLSRGRALLDGAAGLEREFKLMRGLELGELRVGAGPYPATMSVGKAVGLLASRHPSLRIQVVTDDLRAIVEALLAKRLDLVVVDLDLVAGDTRIVTETLPAHVGYFYCRAGHPLLTESNPTLERILEYPFVGARLPPRIAADFLELAKSGGIDRDTGDYLPPIKVDSIRMATDVVLVSDAVAAAPIAFIADEVATGRIVALRARAAWMQTGYGFAFLREMELPPAADAFKAAVWEVENEIAAHEARAAGAANRAPRVPVG